MAFIQAMNSEDHTKIGVNGSDVYTTSGFGNRLVSFYTMLNRGMDVSLIEKNMNELLKGDKATLVDLLVLIFQTRDIRGGKGERDLFYNIMAIFLDKFQGHSYTIIQLIPEFGYYKDLWKLYEKVTFYVQGSIDRFVKEQFEKDIKSEKPSLLAKWIPREGSKFDTLAKHFAELLFPEVSKEENMHLRAYRKAVSELNKKINTTEIKMCGKAWSSIVPKDVPGRLLKKNKLAFLNEMSKKKIKKRNNYTDDDTDDDTTDSDTTDSDTTNDDKKVQLRYPDDKDRNECREHFQSYIEDLKSGKEVAKGVNVIMPHELVKEVYNNAYNCYDSYESDNEDNKKTKDVDDLIQAQWESIRNATKAGGGLKKSVFMCDFSGSMDGEPKLVSLALGILGSELSESAFADHIITFDSEPQWHSFKGQKTLRKKVNKIGRIGQGLNTNFQKACNLILRKLVENKVPKEEAPMNLIVLTDMGFDAACGNSSHVKKTGGWETHFSMIRKSFEAQGYDAPRIVCWNLRGEYNDFHSKADEEGVVNLSGWSASAFKLLQTSGVDAITPAAMLRKILDAPRYDPVRKLAESIF